MSIKNALDTLKTKEDCRSFILSELEEGKDIFGTWNNYPTPMFVEINDRAGDGLKKVHAALDDARKELLEESIFDIILNPSDFFRPTKYGTPGTISEYVGTMLAFHLTWDDTSDPSIKVLLPRFTEKAKEWALKIDHRIRGNRFIALKQTRNGELVRNHSVQLLGLFHHFARMALKDIC